MQGIPDVTQVRAWCGLSTASISDEALEMIRLSEIDTQARLLRVPTDPAEAGVYVEAVLDGYTLTITVTDGIPSAHYRLSAGNGQNGDATTDAGGDATITYTYPNAGTFTVSVTNAASGDVVLTGQIDVPGQESWSQGTPEGEYPHPLTVALLRRCQRAVAAKALPLGMVGDSAGEYGASYLRSWDPEINRLENPYRIPVIA